MKMKRLQIPQKLVCEKFCVTENILRIRNCRCKFIKNFLPEKRKENVNLWNAMTALCYNLFHTTIHCCDKLIRCGDKHSQCSDKIIWCSDELI